jgi:hypothetical protein
VPQQVLQHPPPRSCNGSASLGSDCRCGDICGGSRASALYRCERFSERREAQVSMRRLNSRAAAVRMYIEMSDLTLRGLGRQLRVFEGLLERTSVSLSLSVHPMSPCPSIPPYFGRKRDRGSRLLCRRTSLRRLTAHVAVAMHGKEGYRTEKARPRSPAAERPEIDERMQGAERRGRVAVHHAPRTSLLKNFGKSGRAYRTPGADPPSSLARRCA